MPSFTALTNSISRPAADAGFRVRRDIGRVEGAGRGVQGHAARRQRAVGFLVVLGRQVTGQTARGGVEPLAVGDVGRVGGNCCRGPWVGRCRHPAGSTSNARQQDQGGKSALHAIYPRGSGKEAVPAQICRTAPRFRLLLRTAIVLVASLAAAAELRPWQRRSLLLRSPRPWPWRPQPTCRPWC